MDQKQNLKLYISFCKKQPTHTALILFIFKFGQFFEVLVVNALQSRSIPVTIRRKINLYEILKTIRRRTSRKNFQSIKGEFILL